VVYGKIEEGAGQFRDPESSDAGVGLHKPPIQESINGGRLETCQDSISDDGGARERQWRGRSNFRGVRG
jgi:hypothetical protein